MLLDYVPIFQIAVKITQKKYTKK